MGKIYDALKKAEREAQITRVKHRTSSVEQTTKGLEATETRNAPLQTIRPVREKDSTERMVSTVSPGSEIKSSLFDMSKPPSASKLSQSLFIVHDPNSIASEQIRMLRSTIFNFNKTNQTKSILITSCLPGEGKSTIAANLSVCIANSFNHELLLMEGDLRIPSLHRFFDAHPETAGLAEYLHGNRALSDLIITTTITNLSLLMSGKTPDKPFDLLSQDKIKALLKELKDKYQSGYIIIDSPPIGQIPEVELLIHQVDMMIMIVKSGNTGRELLKKTIDQIGKDKILGIVFNMAREPLHSYYYSHYYSSKK